MKHDGENRKLSVVLTRAVRKQSSGKQRYDDKQHPPSSSLPLVSQPSNPDIALMISRMSIVVKVGCSEATPLPWKLVSMKMSLH